MYHLCFNPQSTKTPHQKHTLKPWPLAPAGSSPAVSRCQSRVLRPPLRPLRRWRWTTPLATPRAAPVPLECPPAGPWRRPPCWAARGSSRDPSPNRSTADHQSWYLPKLGHTRNDVKKYMLRPGGFLFPVASPGVKSKIDQQMQESERSKGTRVPSCQWKMFPGHRSPGICFRNLHKKKAAGFF